MSNPDAQAPRWQTLARERRELEDRELEALRTRLEQAGVRIVEAEARPGGRWNLIIEPALEDTEAAADPAEAGGATLSAEDDLPGLPTLEDATEPPGRSALDEGGDGDEEGAAPDRPAEADSGEENGPLGDSDLFPAEEAGTVDEDPLPGPATEGQRAGSGAEEDGPPSLSPTPADGEGADDGPSAFDPLPGEQQGVGAGREAQPATSGADDGADDLGLPELPPLDDVQLQDVDETEGAQDADVSSSELEADEGGKTPSEPVDQDDGGVLPPFIGTDDEEIDDVEEHEVAPETESQGAVGELDDDRFEPPPEDADISDLMALAESEKNVLRVPTGKKRENRFRDTSDDPRSRATRLARTLASDILAYRDDEDHRVALEEGVAALRTAFADDIRHALSEYEGQIDKDEVEGWDRIFVSAVNEIIGNGHEVLAP